jgi:ABC-type antimicrobial peptide transport system permease subunit
MTLIALALGLVVGLVILSSGLRGALRSYARPALRHFWARYPWSFDSSAIVVGGCVALLMTGLLFTALYVALRLGLTWLACRPDSP